MVQKVPLAPVANCGMEWLGGGVIQREQGGATLPWQEAQNVVAIRPSNDKGSKLGGMVK